MTGHAGNPETNGVGRSQDGRFAGAIVPLGLMLALLIVLLTSPTWALVPAVLLDGELSLQSVTLASIDSQRVRYFDAQRVMRERDLSEVVRLTVQPPPEAQKAQKAPGSDGSAFDESHRPAMFRVQLVDGQRLVGTLAPEASDDEVMWLDHPQAGRLRVPLEQVAWVRWSAGGPAPHAGAPAVDPFGWLARRTAGDPASNVPEDRLWLANGDVLKGFVAQITGEQVIFEPADGKPVELPWDRLEGVALANPAISPLPPAGLDRVTLHDGSVLNSEPVRADGSKVYLRPTLRSPLASGTRQQSVAIPATQVRSINLGRGGRWVLAWSDLSWNTVAGGEAYGLPLSPRVVNGVLTLAAPITAEAMLPGDLIRVAGTLQWPASQPPTSGGVGGRLTADQQLLTVQLNNQKLAEFFGFQASGRVLRLAVSPGPQGPSRSTLACPDALVLIAQPNPASPDVAP